MINIRTLTVALFSFFMATITLQAQMDDAARLDGLVQEESDSLGWTFGAGIGLDLTQILVINPQAGAGQNRFGLGGALGLYANYRDERQTWFSNLSYNLSAEKIGSGVVQDSDGNASDQKVPFRKSIDDLRLNSNYGYKMKEGSKWSYAANLFFRTQLMPSYIGVQDGQVYISEITVEGPYENSLVSKFMNPGRLNLGLGVMYEPNERFRATFTPLTGDIIFVLDQEIANLGIHGTKLEDGSMTEYRTTRFAFGAKLDMEYNNSWVNDRLKFKSNLILFSDYLANPQNVDVIWTNELAFQIVGGLQLSFNNVISYDDDVLSTITDNDAPGGIKVDDTGAAVLRPAVNYYHQLLLKYVYLF